MGFFNFVKNYAKGGFSPFAMLSAISGVNSIKAISSLYRSYTGAGLTGAQQEANAFNAEQAQKQMDFQQQMRDTQYQAGVNDMMKAGLNPALMYGSGASGNVAPSGAMATSVDAGKPQIDPIGLLGQIANLKLLNAQKKDLEASAAEKRANAKRQESEVILNELKGSYQKLVNEWYPKVQQSTISNMQASISDLYASVSLKGYQMDNVQADTALKKTQEFVASLEAQWIPKLRAAQEKGQLASAAQQFAEAAYKNYFKQYAEEHGGVLPGPNQALGIGAALSETLKQMGMNDVELNNLDWKDLIWPWFSFFRKRD